MATPVLQFKRGLLSNLPGLRAGEPGFTTDKYDLYVGLTSETSTNQFVGSGRFWTVENTSRGSGVNLVEASSNGSDYITIASPASLAGIVTYYMPGTQGIPSTVLTNDGNGNLSWSSGSANPTFTGIATFTDTTDNILGNSNTGSVQIDGGLGVDKNVTVGGNLNVQGLSEFIGVVTFRGGTINLGDADTDDVVVGGEFASNLVPTTDDTYSLGSPAKQWKDLYVNGTADIDALIVSGISTFTGAIDSNGGLDVLGHTELDDLNVSGVSTFTGAIDANGGLDVLGHTELDNVNVTGVSTFLGSITGTISTAVRAQTVDITANTLDDNTYYVPFEKGIGNTSLYIDTALSYNPGQNLLDVSNIQVSDLNVTGVSTLGLANATTLSVSGVSTFNGAIDANGGANISGGETILSSATVSDLTSGRVVLAGVAGALEDSLNLTFNGSLLTVTGDVTVTDSIAVTNDAVVSAGLTVTGAVDFNGGANISGGETILSSATVSDLTSGRVVLAGTAGALQDSLNLTFNGTTLNVTGNTTVDNVRIDGNEIDTTSGDLTLDSAGGTVTVDDNLVVNGTFSVLGSQSIINTEILKIEDSLIEVGLVNSGGSLIPPSSNTLVDVGLVMHYYKSSAAKVASVFWDYSSDKLVAASDVTETNGVMAVSSYADFEIGSLYVNDCAGSSQVISCTGSERFLENITIDAGTF